MSAYTVLVVGMGKRGRQHAAAFRANPSFELVGICNPSPAALREAAAQLGNPRTGTDPAVMAAELQPAIRDAPRSSGNSA